MLKTNLFFIPYLFLTLLAFTVISCQSDQPAVQRFLTSSHLVKKMTDEKDSVIYTTFVSTFLDAESKLYGDVNSSQFKQFSKDAVSTYDNLLALTDTIIKPVLGYNNKLFLKDIIRFQKRGIASYYAKVLTDQPANPNLDSLYNKKYNELEHRFLLEQVKVANRYGITLAH